VGVGVMFFFLPTNSFLIRPKLQLFGVFLIKQTLGDAVKEVKLQFNKK
jgi:hypothetical protein